EALAEKLLPLADGYSVWLGERAAEVDGLPEDLQSTARAAIGRARAAAGRIRDGIALLGRSEDALTAFRFANEAMALQRRRTAVAALRERDGLDFAEAERQVNAQGAKAASW